MNLKMMQIGKEVTATFTADFDSFNSLKCKKNVKALIKTENCQDFQFNIDNSNHGT